MVMTVLGAHQRHAVRVLAEEIDASRRALDATIDAVRWDSTSALMLRRLTHDLSTDLRVASWRLRALL